MHNFIMQFYVDVLTYAWHNIAFDSANLSVKQSKMESKACWLMTPTNRWLVIRTSYDNNIKRIKYLCNWNMCIDIVCVYIYIYIYHVKIIFYKFLCFCRTMYTMIISLALDVVGPGCTSYKWWVDLDVEWQLSVTQHKSQWFMWLCNVMESALHNAICVFALDTGRIEIMAWN